MPTYRQFSVTLRPSGEVYSCNRLGYANTGDSYWRDEETGKCGGLVLAKNPGDAIRKVRDHFGQIKQEKK